MGTGHHDDKFEGRNCWVTKAYDEFPSSMPVIKIVSTSNLLAVVSSSYTFLQVTMNLEEQVW